MAERSFVHDPTHVYSVKDKPSLFLAEMLGKEGVKVGETPNGRERPIFVPPSVRSLFESVLQHPSVAVLRLAYDWQAQKPGEMSEDDDRLFTAIRGRRFVDRGSLVVKKYKDDPRVGLRKNVPHLWQSIVCKERQLESKELLDERVKQRIATVLEEIRAKCVVSPEIEDLAS